MAYVCFLDCVYVCHVEDFNDRESSSRRAVVAEEQLVTVVTLAADSEVRIILFRFSFSFRLRTISLPHDPAYPVHTPLVV